MKNAADKNFTDAEDARYARVLDRAQELIESERAKIQAALEWLNEFITEPDFFPNEGDRQFWNEKRKAIQNLIRDI